MADIKLQGFKELDKELAKLPLKFQKQILRKVTREGARVIQKEAKRLVPQDTGALRKSIIIRRDKDVPKSVIQYNVYPSVGLLLAKARLKEKLTEKGLTKKEIGKKVRELGKRLGSSQVSYYAGMVEYGHKDKGKRFVAAKPYMRPAFDGKQKRVIARMKAVFLKELGKYRKG